MLFTTTPSESVLFIAQTLADRGYTISAIVTAPGANAFLTESHFQQLGARVSSYTAALAGKTMPSTFIPPILVVYKASQVEPLFFAQDPDLAVCFGFPYRLSASLLQHRAPVINLHSAPLPDLRGPNPHVWPILRPDRYGLDDFSVTWHYMVPEIDRGPVIKTEVVKIRSGTEQGMTSSMLEREAAAAMLGALDEVVALVEQGHGGRPQTPIAEGDVRAASPVAARILTDEERMITEDMTVDEVMRLFRAIGGTELPPLIRTKDGMYAIKEAARVPDLDEIQHEPGSAQRSGLALRYSCVGGSLMLSLRKL